VTRTTRFLLVLALVSTGLVAGGGIAGATRCNDSDKDLYAGSGSTVFLGVNNDPDDHKGVCVRALGLGGVDAHVPTFSAEPQPGLFVQSAGVEVCVMNALPTNPCVWPSAGTVIDTNRGQVYLGATACNDVVPACVSGNAGAGRDTVFFFVCVDAAGVFKCVTSPGRDGHVGAVPKRAAPAGRVAAGRHRTTRGETT
jgi:hypothetical protein